MIFERAARREFAQAAAGVFVALFAILVSTQLIRLLNEAAGGRLAPEAVSAHHLSIDIQQAVAAAGVPGARCEDLYAMALDMAASAGLSEYFMGLSQQAKFIGHGTGLVINEQPVIGARSKDVLQANMCLALEPKFVIPGSGAVGVEDTFLVTAEGMVTLTPCDQEICVL